MKMKVNKIRYLIIAVIVINLLNVGKVYCGWPFNKTPAIEGIVTDVTTGKPLENVIISCVWFKFPTIGENAKSFAGEIFITDKEGRYKIPGKTTFHLLSKFYFISLRTMHPLYEEVSTDYFSEDIEHLQKGETEYRREGGPHGMKYLKGEYKDGNIHYDIKVIGLEERFLRNDRIAEDQNTSKKMSDEEKRREIAGKLDGFCESYDNGWYWLKLKENNISFDLGETFKVWDSIALKMFIDENFWIMERYNKTKDKIKRRVDKVQ